jgi:RHS repeat-associated protein
LEFGYRYDTETGLYYLQSRYYNPEWGRFINADGIIGQTGELLGHNLYVYTKNNPVNMSDKNGFRPMPMSEYAEETIGATSSIIKTVAMGIVASGHDKSVGDLALDSVKTTHYNIYKTMEGNHATRRAYIRNIPKAQRYTEFIPKNINGAVATYGAKVGIMSTLSLATSINSDYRSYSSSDAPWCIAIDCAAFIGGVFMVAAIPAATPLVAALAGAMIAGAATSYAADFFKSKLFTKKQ